MMDVKEQKYYEREKYKFLQAYNQEATRINKLKEKYPDNEHYIKTDKNLEDMLQVFEFLCQYTLTLHNLITALKIENRMLSEEYMKTFDSQLNELLFKHGKNS